MSSFFSIVVTLFFIINALGSVPVYLKLVHNLPKQKQRWIAIRELLIALVVMILFHYIGEIILSLLGISASTLHVSGGIILFLIAIRLIFPSDDETSADWGTHEPFIVPIAVPLIAGPSLLAAIMIYAQQEPKDITALLAIFIAWLASSIILLLANPLQKLIGSKGLMACQRLMGLILALIAVQMFLEGIEGIIEIIKSGNIPAGHGLSTTH